MPDQVRHDGIEAKGNFSKLSNKVKEEIKKISKGLW
jgi:hypothetical protein